MKRRQSTFINRGFTLIEILIVVVILGILAAIVIPRFADAGQNAAENSIKGNLKTVRTQIEMYRARNAGSPPASIQDLVNADWEYIPKEPVPPDGFTYQYDASTGQYTVACTDPSSPNCPADIDEW